MNAARLALTLAALAALCGCATRRSPATPMAAVRAQAATATAVTATVKARAAVAQAQAAVAKIQPPADAAQAAALEEVRFALSAAAVHLDTVRDAVTTANTAASAAIAEAQQFQARLEQAQSKLGEMAAARNRWRTRALCAGGMCVLALAWVWRKPLLSLPGVLRL